jgi:hypothetical protein
MKILRSKIDRDEWISIWQKWKGKEVFAHPDYLDLYTDDKSEACCAILQTDGAAVIYPFIKRDLSHEPYCKEKLFDITTAYGYGGVYAFGKWNGEMIEFFCKEFASWAKKSNIVCEFIRFALDSPTREFYYMGECVLNNQNVVVDLALSAEEMWSNFKHKVRKNVNRAKSHNLRLEFDEKGYRLDDFLDIYYGTMNRRGASQVYYFPREYFEAIIQKLKGQFLFCHAFYGDKMISTELVLVSDNNIYSFLGGTYDEFFEMRPNDLLKFEIINWGRNNGKKRFVLGGGYAPMDGIFQYKQAFAPEGVVSFFIGKKVFNPQKYNELTDCKKSLKNSWIPNETYFPLYRS